MHASRRLIAAVAIAAASFVPVSSAAARSTDVRVAGQCSASSTSKIKLKNDDGRIEVEFEVDQNRTGRRWQVRIMRGSTVIWRGTRTTAGRSGSFSVNRLVANRPGRDRLTGWAKRVNGAETCRATASI